MKPRVSLASEIMMVPADLGKEIPHYSLSGSTAGSLVTSATYNQLGQIGSINLYSGVITVTLPP